MTIPCPISCHLDVENAARGRGAAVPPGAPARPQLRPARQQAVLRHPVPSRPRRRGVLPHDRPRNAGGAPRARRSCAPHRHGRDPSQRLSGPATCPSPTAPTTHPRTGTCSTCCGCGLAKCTAGPNLAPEATSRRPWPSGPCGLQGRVRSGGSDAGRPEPRSPPCGPPGCLRTGQCGARHPRTAPAGCCRGARGGSRATAPGTVNRSV